MSQPESTRPTLTTLTPLTKNFRYLRWREARRRPIWAVDQHWYALLARLAEDPSCTPAEGG